MIKIDIFSVTVEAEASPQAFGTIRTRQSAVFEVYLP